MGVADRNHVGETGIDVFDARQRCQAYSQVGTQATREPIRDAGANDDEIDVAGRIIIVCRFGVSPNNVPQRSDRGNGNGQAGDGHRGSARALTQVFEDKSGKRHDLIV